MLEYSALFGTFQVTTAYNGTIVPLTYVVRSALHPNRTHLFAAIPANVPPDRIQLQTKYQSWRREVYRIIRIVMPTPTEDWPLFTMSSIMSCPDLL